MEELQELIKLPFDILSAAEGNSKGGYGILMVIFAIGITVMVVSFFEMVYKIIKRLITFFENSWDSFTGIFKNRQKSAVNPKQFDLSLDHVEELLEEKHLELMDQIRDEISKKQTSVLDI